MLGLLAIGDAIVSESNTTGAIVWQDFVAEQLLIEPRVPFRLKYDALEEIEISAVTALNLSLFRKAINGDIPGVVFSICDYSSEALAFAVSRAIENVLDTEGQFNIAVAEIEPGTPIRIGDVVAEYVAVSNHEFKGEVVPYLTYKTRSRKKSENDIKRSMPISQLPLVQVCREGTGLTPSGAKALRSSMSVDDAESPSQQELRSKMSLVKNSIVLATSVSPFANIPPTSLNKAQIFLDGRWAKLTDCLLAGRFSKDGIEFRNAGNVDGIPSLLAARRGADGFADLFDVIDYLENGGSIDCLILEAPTAECVERQRTDLEEIIGDYKVPIVVFCEESVPFKTRVFEEMGFASFAWNRNRLTELSMLAKRSKYSLTHREQCAANVAIRTYAVPDDGRFSPIAEYLYELNKTKACVNDDEQSALLSLIRVLGQLLKQTEAVDENASAYMLSKINNATDILTGSSGGYSLSGQQVRHLKRISDTLIDMSRVGSILPKEGVTYDAIMDAVLGRDKSLCLVVSNSFNEQSCEAYWRSILNDEGADPTKLRAISSKHFLKEKCTSDEEVVLLSGWFQREEMERLEKSGLSSEFSIVAYRGEDGTKLETQWHSSADAFWNSRRLKQDSMSQSVLSRIDIDSNFIHDENKATDSVNKIPADESLAGVARRIEAARDKSQASRPGEDSHMGRCVWFTSGANRWLRVEADNGGDKLAVLTDILNKDGWVRKVTAGALQEGDIVAKIDLTESALNDACKQIEAYGQVAKTARSWYAPIESSKKYMSESNMIRRIEKAGCDRNPATIKRWISDPTFIAPQDRADVALIGKAFNAPFSDNDLDQIMSAASYVRGCRINNGRDLHEKALNEFAGLSVMHGGFEDAIAEFNSKNNEICRIELLQVDHVGDPVEVPLGRFGFFSD